MFAGFSIFFSFIGSDREDLFCEEKKDGASKIEVVEFFHRIKKEIKFCLLAN